MRSRVTAVVFGVCLGCSFPGAWAAEPPLNVVLDKPFYANGIFPGQTIARIEGRATVSMAIADPEGARLQIVFSGPSMAGVPVGEWPVRERQAAFSFPIRDLADGDYTLDCRLVRQGAVLAGVPVLLRKLPTPADGHIVYIDENRKEI